MNNNEVASTLKSEATILSQDRILNIREHLLPIESFEVMCRKLVEFDGYLFTLRLTLLNKMLVIRRLVNDSGR